MELGEIDGSGRRRPVPIKGSEFTMSFDNIIVAIGQRPEIPRQFNLATGQGNAIHVDPDTLATSRQGVFAAGDAVSGPTSVIEAIAAGRNAAIAIDKYLGGDGVIDEKLVEIEEPTPCLGPGDGFADMCRVQMPCLPLELRMAPAEAGHFAEVEMGFTEEMAMEEAARCLQCQLRFQIQSVAPPPAK
jgi:hypothetical protein